MVLVLQIDPGEIMRDEILPLPLLPFKRFGISIRPMEVSYVISHPRLPGKTDRVLSGIRINLPRRIRNLKVFIDLRRKPIDLER
jgi:hypothetical protein